MRRSLFTLWLGASLAACALSLGCSHGGHGCPTCGGPVQKLLSSPAISRFTSICWEHT